MKSQSIRIRIGSRIHMSLAALGLSLVRVGDGSHLRQIRRSMRQGMLLNACEAFQLAQTAKAAMKLPGDFAEVGVYRGGSARLMCEVKGDRPMHLFDTFDGLPPATMQDGQAPRFWTHQFACPEDIVRRYLRSYPEVFLYRGLFPESAGALENRMFSFVHIDVDLHDATAACLEWFYPRMVRSGVMMCHDYLNAPGVRTAVDEFFVDKPEIVIQQPAGSHCLIVKLETGQQSENRPHV